MAETTEGTEGTEPPEGGETNEQKAAREQREREINAAEARVKKWTTEAMEDFFKKNPQHSQNSQTKEPASSQPSAASKKSLLEKILGI